MSGPTTTTWYGFALGRYQHPTRPWWVAKVHVSAWRGRDEETWATWTWCRVDGVEIGPVSASEADDAEVLLANYDRQHPLPRPEPELGQVWVGAVSEARGIVQAVAPKGGYGRLTGQPEVLIMGRWYTFAEFRDCFRHCVLVLGPGAPWAPMEERTDGE